MDERLIFSLFQKNPILPGYPNSQSIFFFLEKKKKKKTIKYSFLNELDYTHTICLKIV